MSKVEQSAPSKIGVLDMFFQVMLKGSHAMWGCCYRRDSEYLKKRTFFWIPEFWKELYICDPNKNTKSFYQIQQRCVLTVFSWNPPGQQKHQYSSPKSAVTRVQGLPIRGCARGCNNCMHTRAQIRATRVITTILFESSYIVSGKVHLSPHSNFPIHPQLRVFSLQLFLDLWANFSLKIPSFFGHQDSPSNLAESR